MHYNLLATLFLLISVLHWADYLVSFDVVFKNKMHCNLLATLFLLISVLHWADYL